MAAPQYPTDKPATICIECQCARYSEEMSVYYCTASGLHLWSRVSGEFGVKACETVNKGDCAFYVEKE